MGITILKDVESQTITSQINTNSLIHHFTLNNLFLYNIHVKQLFGIINLLYLKNNKEIDDQNMCSDEDFVFAATGDSLITRRLSVYSEPHLTSLFKLLRDADITFTNLETLIHSYEGYAAAESGGTWMASPPYIADELKWAGFNLVSRANNHAMDYSVTGMRVTSSHLDRVDIKYSGVGESLSEARAPVYLDTKAGRIGLISVTSTFPTHAMAGNGRDGIPSRPGLNPLRHSIEYEIDVNSAEILKKIGFEIIHARERNEVRDIWDDEFHLFGSRFKIGDNPGIKYQVNTYDLNSNLTTIRGAKKQCDWLIVSIHNHERKNGDRGKAADFIQDFSRSCIDMGADVVVGHGAEVLRGIEIYRDKPIMYSLGCFALQQETVNSLPDDIYERYDLNKSALPSDLHDIREVKSYGKGWKWITHFNSFWESVVAICKFEDNTLKEIKFHPIDLGFGKSRLKRGQPMIADLKLSKKIIDRLQKLSKDFGTEIKLSGNIGVVDI